MARRASLLLVLLAGLALAASVAGCGSATTSPSPPATQAAPTFTPAASPSPTASPTRAGEAVIQGLLARYSGEDVPFHVAFDGTVNIDATAAVVRGELDTVRSDAAGTISLGGGGTGTKVEVILVGGDAYARLPGGRWQKAENIQQTQPINPFQRLEAKDLEYLGTQERAGGQLHHLRTTKWTGDDPRTMRSRELTDVRIESVRFDIYTESDGEPVEAKLVFRMRGRSAGTPVTLSGDFDYRFSDFGKPVTIRRPAP